MRFSSPHRSIIEIEILLSFMRCPMSFVPNSAQQISLFDKLAFLSKRKQKMIEKSWAQLSQNVLKDTRVRIILCLVPQNRWLTNESPVMWGIIRNIPFVCIGVIVICLYYRNRDKENTLRSVWLLVSLSFLFYIPVAVGAGAIPMLGMLMLPKTVCYMILIWIFIKYAGRR